MSTVVNPASPPVVLNAATAADLMSANPVSIRDDATVQDAVVLLTDKGFSAAPVINDAGHPVGVLSRTDILVHDREKTDYVPPLPEFYERAQLGTRLGAQGTGGYQIVNVDQTPVGSIMTPVVFSVSPDTPAAEVVQQMRSLRVHRLFVVDEAGVLIGVVSTWDILRRLEI